MKQKLATTVQVANTDWFRGEQVKKNSKKLTSLTEKCKENLKVACEARRTLGTMNINLTAC